MLIILCVYWSLEKYKLVKSDTKFLMRIGNLLCTTLSEFVVKSPTEE